MTHEFNSEMFPGMRALGNASAGDASAFNFQVADALRGKNEKKQQPKKTQSQPKPQGNGK